MVQRSEDKIKMLKMSYVLQQFKVVAKNKQSKPNMNSMDFTHYLKVWKTPGSDPVNLERGSLMHTMKICVERRIIGQLLKPSK